MNDTTCDQQQGEHPARTPDLRPPPDLPVGGPFSAAAGARSSPSPTTRSLEFLSVPALLASTESRPEALWKPLLVPGAVTLLGGKPKAGKSTLVYDLIGRLERGEQFLGSETTRCSAVVVTEEGALSVREKVERFGIEESVFLPRSFARFKLSLNDILRATREEALQLGARVIVIDTLAGIASAGLVRESDAGAMQALMSQFMEIAAAGFSVLLLHHTRKKSGGGFDAFRGSSALSAAADILALIDAPGSQATQERALDVIGRFDGSGAALTYSLVEDHHELLDDLTGSTEDERQGRMLDILLDASKHGLTCSAWIAAAEVGKQSGLGIIERLLAAGELSCTGAGVRGDPRLYRVAHRRESTAEEAAQDSGPTTTPPSGETRDQLHIESPAPPVSLIPRTQKDREGQEPWIENGGVR